MKKVVLAAVLLISGLGISTSAFAVGRNNVGVNFGMAPGGMTIGGDYEFLHKRSYGFGAMARSFQKDTDNGANGLFVIGGNVRMHHKVDELEFSVAPGVAIINEDGTDRRGRSDDTTSIGPTFSLALTYALTDAVAIGLENSRYWIWLDEDFRGQRMDDTSVRLTFNF